MTDLTTAYLLGLATSSAGIVAGIKIRAWLHRRRESRAWRQWRQVHLFRG